MATTKQKRIVKAVIENQASKKPKALGVILRENGYGKIANQPNRVLQSKGVVQLFKEAGIDATNIAKGYNDLMDLPLENNTISVDQRRKLLHDLKEIIIDNPETKLAPQYNFISKFLNVQMLKGNKPTATEQLKEPEIIE